MGINAASHTAGRLLHTHYLASSEYTYLQFMAKINKTRSGGSYSRYSLTQATLLPWTGSENHLRSTAVCQPASLRIELLHPRCLHYLKTRCRFQSRRCEMCRSTSWLRSYTIHLDSLSAPRFAARRLRLPCIHSLYRNQTEAWSRPEGTVAFEIKADGFVTC